MKKAIFTDIDWATDGQKSNLPKKCTLDVDDETTKEDLEMDGADLLSDKYGWLVNGFNVEIEEA